MAIIRDAAKIPSKRMSLSDESQKLRSGRIKRIDVSGALEEAAISGMRGW
jgi:hypothetical protein